MTISRKPVMKPKWLQENPFPCGICSLGFPKKGDLPVHMEMIHGRKDADVKGIQPEQCGICNKRFANMFQVSVHRRVYHVPSRCERYSSCKFWTRDPARMDRHVVKCEEKFVMYAGVKFITGENGEKIIDASRTKTNLKVDDIVAAEDDSDDDEDAEEPEGASSAPIRLKNLMNLLSNPDVSKDVPPSAGPSPVAKVPDRQTELEAAYAKSLEASKQVESLGEVFNFSCEMCEKKFKDVESGKEHVIRVHRISRMIARKKLKDIENSKVEVDDGKIRPFLCEVCDKRFEVKKSAIEHVMAAHKFPNLKMAQKQVRKLSKEELSALEKKKSESAKTAPKLDIVSRAQEALKVEQSTLKLEEDPQKSALEKTKVVPPSESRTMPNIDAVKRASEALKMQKSSNVTREAATKSDIKIVKTEVPPVKPVENSKKETTNGPFACQKCSMTFKFKLSLEYHTISIHGDDDDSEEEDGEDQFEIPSSKENSQGVSEELKIQKTTMTGDYGKGLLSPPKIQSPNLNPVARAAEALKKVAKRKLEETDDEEQDDKSALKISKVSVRQNPNVANNGGLDAARRASAMLKQQQEEALESKLSVQKVFQPQPDLDPARRAMAALNKSISQRNPDMDAARRATEALNNSQIVVSRNQMDPNLDAARRATEVLNKSQIVVSRNQMDLNLDAARRATVALNKSQIVVSRNQMDPNLDAARRATEALNKSQIVVSRNQIDPNLDAARRATEALKRNQQLNMSMLASSELGNLDAARRATEALRRGTTKSVSHNNINNISMAVQDETTNNIIYSDEEADVSIVKNEPKSNQMMMPPPPSAQPQQISSSTQNSSAAKKGPKYKCKVCPHIAQSVDSIKQHLRSNHTRQEIEECAKKAKKK